MTQHAPPLALFGTPPRFAQPLTVGQPDLSSRQRVLQRIESVLDSGWLTNNGPVVRQFEDRICEITGADECVAVCNGTMALQIMARACNLTGEVIVPAMTYIATAHALEWIGLTPVFADVHAATHTLNVDSVRDCITSRTSAILGVHLWGNPCDCDALQQLADQHDLQLLFDASHAFGNQHHGRSIGTFGAAEAFSFHATKFVHCVEGGAVLTRSPQLAQRMRLLRNFGITGFSSVESEGINGKLNEVSAAVGLTSLESLSDRMRHNRHLQQEYRAGTADCPGIRLLPMTADNGGNGQYAVLMVDESKYGMHRDHLLQILRAEGIFARSYFVPGCHRSHPYCDSGTAEPTRLPATEAILDRVLQCPTGPAVTADAVQVICDVMRLAGRSAHAVNARIRSGCPLCRHPDDPAASSVALPLAG